MNKKIFLRLGGVGFISLLCIVLASCALSGAINSGIPTKPINAGPLTEFPLRIGTTWVYSYRPYDQLPSDSSKTMTATYLLTETVIGIEESSRHFVAEVVRTRELISKPSEWSQEEFEEAEKIWYVISGTLIFEQGEEPDPLNFTSGYSTLLTYNLPLTVGKQWCPHPLDLGNPDVVHCEASGMRVVTEQRGYETPVGEVENCYQVVEVYTSGGVRRWFCDGIGVVAASYDHSGTQFGFEQELIDYSSGLQ